MSKVRDLEADLAICEAATPGPWRWKEGYGLERMKLVGEFEIMNFGVGGTYDQVAGMEPDEDDAQFIAEARTGWPYAIRRVMELEKELERVRDERDFWDRNEYVLGLKVEQLEKELEQREAEIDRLRNELNILQEQLEQRCAQV